MIESGNILPSKLLTKPIPRVEKKTNSGIILPNQVVKDVNISSTVVKIGSGVPADILIKEILFFFHHFTKEFFPFYFHGEIIIPNI